ncbi:hypothetical protein LXL04_012067 [Taraxacum kok-saghyz]
MKKIGCDEQDRRLVRVVSALIPYSNRKPKKLPANSGNPLEEIQEKHADYKASVSRFSRKTQLVAGVVDGVGIQPEIVSPSSQVAGVRSEKMGRLEFIRSHLFNWKNQIVDLPEKTKEVCILSLYCTSKDGACLFHSCEIIMDAYSTTVRLSWGRKHVWKIEGRKQDRGVLTNGGGERGKKLVN